MRMASIPHGTTIEAQGTSSRIAGGPRIEPVNITPFPIGSSGPPPSSSQARPRRTPLPSGCPRTSPPSSPPEPSHSRSWTTPTHPEEPRRAQNITSTTVNKISTNPANPLFGGGTDNIAFLLGDKDATTPNADAIQMSATFWIETVTSRSRSPPIPPTARYRAGSHQRGQPGGPLLGDLEDADRRNRTIDVSYTQIQYTQTVLLNFNNLTWPHVSVATLVPNKPVPVAI